MQIQLPEGSLYEVFLIGSFSKFFSSEPDSLHGEASDWSTYLLDSFIQGAQTGPSEMIIEALIVNFPVGSD